MIVVARARLASPVCVWLFDFRICMSDIRLWYVGMSWYECPLRGPSTNRKTRKRHGCSNVTPSAVFSHILVLGRWLPTGFTRRRCPKGRRPSACSRPRRGRRSRCRRRRRYCRRARPASGSSARCRGRGRGMGGRDWYLERLNERREPSHWSRAPTEPTRSHDSELLLGAPARARDTRQCARCMQHAPCTCTASEQYDVTVTVA